MEMDQQGMAEFGGGGSGLGSYGGSDEEGEEYSSYGPGRPSTVRDHILLGDLHMKQNKQREAIRAYEKALSRLYASGDEGDTIRTRGAGRSVTTEVYTKLAQASLASGDVKTAKKWLDQAMSLRNREPESAGSRRASASAMPTKLMISAPKTLLDGFRAGSISLDDFKKAAVVEHLTFEGQ